MSIHPFLDWSGPLAFAHRGGTSHHPENTLAAFRHAVELGYTYLETDVHATADGVLVAFHDPDLARTCGRPGRIDELPWSEVSEARVDGREPIPLFEDLMEEFPEARVNIDCKADGALEPLIAVLRKLDCLDRVCVGSFSDRRLGKLRSAFGERLCSSFGPFQILAWRFLGGRAPWGGQVAQISTDYGPLRLVTEASVARSHRRGYQVHVWTIDDPDEMRRLLDIGVDGIMTDRPLELKQVLLERGQWQ